MQVLVIDENEQQRKTFQLLLDFVDYDTVAVDFQQWQTLAEPPEFVILAESNDKAKNLAELKALKQELGEAMPVLFATRQLDKSDLPNELASLIVTTIHTPLKHRQLVHALHLAEVYRESKVSDGSSSPMLFRSLVGNSRAIVEVRSSLNKLLIRKPMY